MPTAQSSDAGKPEWTTTLRLIVEDMIRAGRHRITDVLIDMLEDDSSDSAGCRSTSSG